MSVVWDRVLSDDVEKVIRLLDNLSESDRADFFWYCNQRWHFRHERTNHQDFDRPWKDPRNGFSMHQAWLLAFLDAKGRVAEREVLKARWSPEYHKARCCKDKELYKTLQDRLRQAERSTRRRLRLLREDWILSRPCRGHLELHIEQRH
jgi:hypothetical protein